MSLKVKNRFNFLYVENAITFSLQLTSTDVKLCKCNTDVNKRRHYSVGAKDLNPDE